MKYQIDTIPVWEALEFHGACMLCTLRAKTEADEVDRVLGASVMEPDVRVRTNDRGICAQHQRMMFAAPNRLGHALLMDTHAMQVLQKLENIKKAAAGAGKPSFKPFASRDLDNRTAVAIRELAAHCVVCETIQTHIERYLYTIVHLLKTEPKFRRQFAESKGVCIPHTADLIEASGRHLNAKEYNEFMEMCMNLLISQLSEDEKDLNWFTQKFDYKNQHKPWGNSKNAIERTVNRLRGYCLGDAPYDKPKK